MDGNIKEVLVSFHPSGSLATTHNTQGSDMGFSAGLLGWDLTDDRILKAENILRETGIEVNFEIEEFEAEHPNTYKIVVNNEKESYEVTAISAGGGMIEITKINDLSLSICGDFYETLIFSQNVYELDLLISNSFDAEYLINYGDSKNPLLQIKSHSFLPEKLKNHIRTKFDINSIKELNPVLPVLSSRHTNLPFKSYKEMLEYNATRNYPLWKLGVIYESERSKLTDDEVIERMTEIINTLKVSLKNGLRGTEFNDRILGFQSGKFEQELQSNSLLDGGLLNKIILYITALMEVKSSMGIIIAAPTAGSCGALPGTLLAYGDELGLSSEEIAKAMFAAGLIGIFVLHETTFAAEIAGCQAECGTGSGMAAAALVDLAGGSSTQAFSASSMALQNIFGMVCDPVANRVEVPCLGKNIMAASNAFSCANMALAGYDQVIPLDEVILAMDKVGRSLPRELRCTALGGLSITKTSKRIEERLNRNT
jgi:L-serine dehydratase